MVCWLIVLSILQVSGEGVAEKTRSSDQATSMEPSFAAALNAQPTVSIKETIPLSFGALVKGDSRSFIELTPDGAVFASGEITGQSQYSHIGAANLTNFSSNPLYRIHPGRLSFDVSSVAQNGTVRVEFLDGDLSSGVSLSNLSIDVGPGTSGGLLRLPTTAKNVVEFQATDSFSQASVDIAFGGRLSLSKYSSGEVNTPVTVNISVENPSSAVLAMVYEHYDYRGRSWAITEEREFQIAEVRRNIGNDIISSIRVAPGYKLRACEHAHREGRCVVFTNDIPRLSAIRFNDVISLLEVLGKH